MSEAAPPLPPPGALPSVPTSSFVGNEGEKWLFHFADEKRLKASFPVPYAITSELEPEARSPRPFSISPGSPQFQIRVYRLCLPCLPLLSPVSETQLF